MNQNEVFRSLGLDDKESSVYLALLELGESPVARIADKAGVKRPTGYLVLGSLEKKGLINRIARGKKVLFAPQHPRKLETEAEFRLKEIREIVPRLESLFSNKEGRPRVSVCEGKETLDRAYDESLLAKGEVLFMSTLELSADVFPRTFRKYGYVSFSPDFRVRELVPDTAHSHAHAQRVSGPYYGVRFIAKEFLPFEADIGIFSERVLITSVKGEYFTVNIESKEINHAFRTLFEALWRISSTRDGTACRIVYNDRYHGPADDQRHTGTQRQKSTASC